jgi:hypothetical protein
MKRVTQCNIYNISTLRYGIMSALTNYVKKIQILFDINNTINNINILLYIYLQNTRIGKYEF